MDSVWNQKSLKEFRHKLVFTSNHACCSSPDLHDVGSLYLSWLWAIMVGCSSSRSQRLSDISICFSSLLRNHNNHNLRLRRFLRCTLWQRQLVISHSFIIRGIIVLLLYYRQDSSNIINRLNTCKWVCDLNVWCCGKPDR